jgi:hypothetical protein
VRQVKGEHNDKSIVFGVPLFYDRQQLADGYPHPWDTLWGFHCWLVDAEGDITDSNNMQELAYELDFDTPEDLDKRPHAITVPTVQSAYALTREDDVSIAYVPMKVVMVEDNTPNAIMTSFVLAKLALENMGILPVDKLVDINSELSEIS